MPACGRKFVSRSRKTSGRECIRWIDPGLAAVCQACLVTLARCLEYRAGL